MRYFVINLEKLSVFNISGKSVNTTPMKHLQRTLHDYELFFVTDGELYMRQNEEICVKKGEALVQAKGGFQGGTRFSSNTFYWLHFDGEVELANTEEEAEEICKRAGKWIFFAEHFSLHDSERIFLMLTELNHYYFEKDGTLVRDALLTALLAELAIQYRRSESYKVDRRFGELLGYLHLHVLEALSLEEIAEKFSYNAKYLSRLFRKHTGKTAKEYLTELKLKEAKKLLVGGSDTVRQIAYLIGYADEYYFMRAFKKATGMTPSAYRKTFCACNYT